jgi:hypothetical protein
MATLQFSFPCLEAKPAKPGLLDITGLGHIFDFRPDQPQKLIIVNMWRAIGGAPIRQKLSLVHPDGEEIFAAEAEVTASDEGTAIVTQVEFGPIPPGTYYIRVHESGEVEPKVEYPVVLTMRAR